MLTKREVEAEEGEVKSLVEGEEKEWARIKNRS